MILISNHYLPFCPSLSILLSLPTYLSISLSISLSLSPSPSLSLSLSLTLSQQVCQWSPISRYRLPWRSRWNPQKKNRTLQCRVILFLLLLGIFISIVHRINLSVCAALLSLILQICFHFSLFLSLSPLSLSISFLSISFSLYLLISLSLTLDLSLTISLTLTHSLSFLSLSLFLSLILSRSLARSSAWSPISHDECCECWVHCWKASFLSTGGFFRWPF